MGARRSLGGTLIWRWLGLGLALWAGIAFLTGAAWLAGRDGHQPVLAVVGSLGGQGQDIYLIDLRGPVLNLTKTPARYGGLRWSPDGRWLAYLANRGDRVDLFVLDAETGARRDLSGGAYPLTLLDAPAWTPDGRAVTIAAMRQIVAFDLESGAARALLPYAPLGPLVEEPAWSPDGAYLAFVQELLGGQSRSLALLDAATGALRSLSDDGRVMGDLAWSPDGAWLAYTTLATGDYELFALHLDSGEVRNLSLYPGYDAGPAWSPDGRFIAFMTDRWGSGDIYATSLMPGDPRRLTSSPSRSLNPVWSPDGRWLAYLGGGSPTHGYALEVRTGAVRELTRPDSVQQGPAWWP